MTENYNQAKFIEGYDKYILFSNGNILNCENNKWIKHTKTKDGYIRIALYKNKKIKLFYLHQLIGKAFIQNNENKQFIDHINHIRDDNRIDNLRWVTRNENQKNTSKQNSVLFRGVSFDKKNNTWQSKYVETEGKNKRKSFSVNKFGYKQALKHAVEARYQAELLYDYTILQTPTDFFNSDIFINIEN